MKDELSIIKYIQRHRIVELDQVFILITDYAYLTAVVIILLVFLIANIRKSSAIFNSGKLLSICLVVNTILVTILKYTFLRPRPFEASQEIVKLSTGGSPSFPSGHTADAFLIAFVFLSVIKAPNYLKLAILIWAIAVAYSRIVLGVHYGSDILGSIILAGISLFLGNKIFKYVKQRKATV